MTTVAITGLVIGAVLGSLGTIEVQKLRRRLFLLRRKLRKLTGPKVVARRRVR